MAIKPKQILNTALNAGKSAVSAAERRIRGRKSDGPSGAPSTVATTWCGHCVRLKRGLQAAGIGFQEVNIEQDAAAAELVMAVNGGNMTVPTIVLPDGATLTNPELEQVQARLAKAG